MYTFGEELFETVNQIDTAMTKKTEVGDSAMSEVAESDHYYVDSDHSQGSSGPICDLMECETLVNLLKLGLERVCMKHSTLYKIITSVLPSYLK